MLTLLKDRIFLIYVIIFAISTKVLHANGYPLEDILVETLVLGIIFPLLAYLMSKNALQLHADKALQKNEPATILLVILYIIIWLSWGTGWITKMLPKENEKLYYLLNIARKIIFFVLIPYVIYRFRFGFGVKDFGIGYPLKQTFSRKTLLIIIGIGIPMLLFQYFLGGGAAPIREGKFTVAQLTIGLPLVFISLVLEVGLVEEFFFRAFLQSRLTVWLKSPRAGILISGLIFGLAHFPGLWLRGASALEGLDPHAGWGAVLAITIVNLSIAGIFLGIIWHYKKNLWLVMIIHALVDLLPNLGEFVNVFNI